MSDVQFHQTRMGMRFYEHTAPEFVRQVSRLADVLERLLERLPASLDPAPNSDDEQEEG